MVRLTALLVLVAGCGGNSGPDAAKFCEANAEIAAIDLYEGNPATRVENGMTVRDLLVEAISVAPADIVADTEATLAAFERIIELTTPGNPGAFDGPLLLQAQADALVAYAPVQAWTAANCAAGG